MWSYNDYAHTNTNFYGAFNIMSKTFFCFTSITYILCTTFWNQGLLQYLVMYAYIHYIPLFLPSLSSSLTTSTTLVCSYFPCIGARMHAILDIGALRDYIIVRDTQIVVPTKCWGQSAYIKYKMLT